MKLLLALIFILLAPSLVHSDSTHKEDQVTRGSQTIIVSASGNGGYSHIQWAIENASDGDTVFVYSDTYYERVVLNKRIKLVGDNRDVTFIDGGDGPAVNITADGVNVTGFTIINSTNDIGIKLTGVQNCQIIRNNASNNLYGIHIEGGGNNTISNNGLSYNVFGIYLNSSSNNRIYHNNLIDNTNQAYDNTNTNFWNHTYPSSGNYWSDYAGEDTDGDSIGDTPYTNISGAGRAQDDYPLKRPFGNIPVNQPPLAVSQPKSQTIYVGDDASFNASGSYDIDGIIESYQWNFGDHSPYEFGLEVTHVFTTPGNYTATLTVTDDNGAADGDLARIVVIERMSKKKIIYVDYNYTDSETGLGSTKFKVIENAIDASDPGDTIYIYNGTYYEQITVSKTLTIIGENREGVIIYGNCDGSLLTISADGVNVSSLSIVSNYINFSSNNTIGLKIEKGTCNTINNCNISNTRYGLKIGMSSNNVIENNILYSNYEYGIMVPTDNNTISNNSCINSLSGIWLRGSENILINNICERNNNGILVSESERNSIIKNRCNKNYDGISLVDPAKENIIENNTCNFNSNAGIKLSGMSWLKEYNKNVGVNYIRYNICEKNNYGIWIRESDGNIITYNQLRNNTEHGICFPYEDNEESDYSFQNAVYYNTLINNNDGEGQAYDYGNYNYWSDPYNQGNYWSDYTMRYPKAKITGVFWDQPYKIDGNGRSLDYFPLAYPKEEFDMFIRLELGPILDEKERPVEAAKIIVTVDDIEYISFTDADGMFFLMVPPGANISHLRLYVTRTGYKPVNFELQVNNDVDLIYDIPTMQVDPLPQLIQTIHLLIGGSIIFIVILVLIISIMKKRNKHS